MKEKFEKDEVFQPIGMHECTEQKAITIMKNKFEKVLVQFVFVWLLLA